MSEQEFESPAAVEATAPAAPQGGVSFVDLGLRPEILRAIADMGFSEPMQVQLATIPLIRKGRDLMVQSRTGSGKTAAFGIPLVDWIASPQDKFVQAIVLLPTRELALQVAAEMARLGAHSNVAVVPVYGGAPMGRQIEQLRAGGQVVCGTPGRVLDHIRRGTLKLDRVRCAVLDECDEMLSMGFQEDIEAILEHTPAERQTLLFSATVPDGIQRLSRRYLRDPELVKLSADFVGVHEIQHLYYVIPGGQRENELLRVLAFENPERAIIFCNTREETGRVSEFLRRNGLDAEAISSDLSQSDRERVMGRMRKGEIRFLVATDVAARGIDLENLPCVINYSIPESPEIYIHRTGRTGRAGRHGIAISLIGPTEVGSFYYIKLLYKIRPEERSLPSETEIRSRREGERVQQLRAALPEEPGTEWRSLARRVMSALDGERLVAAMLHKSLGLEAGAKPAARVAPVTVAERPVDRERPAEREREPEQDRVERGRERFRQDRGRGARSDRTPREARPPREDRPVRENRPVRFCPPSSEAGPEFADVWSNGSPPAAKTEREDFASAWSDGAERQRHSPRAERVEHPERVEVPEGQARLYVNLGRKDGASAEEIAGLLATERSTTSVQAIEVMNTHSYVNVPADEADRLCAAVTGKERGGRRLICERARPPKRR